MATVPEISNSLVDGLAAGVGELRGSLTELLGQVGTDGSKPQVLSRALGIDKNLAWKVSKIIRSRELAIAVQHFPGSAGFEILLSAVQRAGAAAPAIQRARSAIESIESMVDHHVGDRPTLELVLDSLPGPSRDRLILSRKLAFRGNSGIWGVQAKTRINTAIIAPSTVSPDMIDAAIVGGWIDFRRLRADSRWALFRRNSYGIPEDAMPREMPIDPDAAPNGPMLMQQFCSNNLPPIESMKDPNGDTVYELGPSLPGNPGAFTCFFGSLRRSIGERFRSDSDDVGEFAAFVSAPVEKLQFDLLVHRELQFAANAKVRVYGSMLPRLDQRHERDLLPLSPDQRDLGRFPPVVDTPAVAGYSQLIDQAMTRCQWNRQDFIGIRYELEYPPFPSTVVITFPLAVPI